MPKTISENAVEAQIVSFMQRLGWRPTRNHVGLFQRVNGTGKIKVGFEGQPDWQFTRNANKGYGITELIFVEVKRPGKKPTDKQFEVMASLNHIGELAVWADSLENFKVVYFGYFPADENAQLKLVVAQQLKLVIKLRTYQEEMVSETRAAFAKGFKRVLLVAPTGSGKGSIASHIIHSAAAKGNKIMFIVNRRELTKDMSKRLKRLDIHHGIMMGAQSHGSHLPVQIASVDTLRNRIDKVSAPDLVFVDECHLALSEKFQEIINKLAEKGAKVILMTATPCRLDGRGLKEIADVMVQGPTVESLIEQEHLVPPVVYAPSTPDISGVHKVAGDLNQGELAEVMSTKKLVGDIVTHWNDLAYGRKTVVFCVNRRHANEVSASFNAAGVKSVAVDANTSDKERDATWKHLANGSIPVVCSVGIISYGWDVPEVDCVVLARPTLSKALHLQQCGRGLRPSKGKTSCLILDHAGNTLRHGLPEDPQSWTLQGRKKKSDEEATILPLPKVCPKCKKVARAAICQCGYTFAAARAAEQRTMETEAGQLVRVESRVYIYPKATGDVATDALIGVAQRKNYNPGWIHHRQRLLETARAEYRDVFGTEPKEYWEAAQLKAMVKRQGNQKGLEL